MMANHFHRSCSVASASLTSCGSLVENVVPAASFTDVVAAFTAMSSRPAWSYAYKVAANRTATTSQMVVHTMHPPQRWMMRSHKKPMITASSPPHTSTTGVALLMSDT